MLVLRDRILMEDGISLIAEYRGAEILARSGKIPEHLKVIPSDDATKYKQYYQQDIVYSGSEEQAQACKSIQKDELNACTVVELWNIIHNAAARNRIDITGTSARIECELLYFQRHNLVSLLQDLVNLVERFRETGVVWSGRGSSCASYVLYILGVHDVDPVRYNIPFEEFSKGL